MNYNETNDMSSYEINWIDKQGTRWSYDAAWEGCEYRDDTNGYTCDSFAREYVGIRRDGTFNALCAKHFEEVKLNSRSFKRKL